VAGGIRVLVGVADVDSAVAKATPSIATRHRKPTVYAGVRHFPDVARAALHRPHLALRKPGPRGIVIEMVVAADGSIASNSIIPGATAQPRATDVQTASGPWIEEGRPAAENRGFGGSSSAGSKLPGRSRPGAAGKAATELGALTFDRLEAQPVFTAGVVTISRLAARIALRN